MKFMLLLCMLVVGSGTMWAEDELYYTLDGTIITGGNSNYAQDGGGLTQNDISWSVTGNTTINPWRIGGKNLSAVDREAYTKTAMSEVTTKIELELGSITLTSVNSIKLVVASNSDFSTVIETITKNSITANSTLTFTPSNSSWPKNSYYKFVFNVSAGSSNSYVQLKSAKFYKAKATSDSPLASITLSGDYPTSFTEGDEFSHEGMTVTATYEDQSTADVTSSATFTGYNMTVLDQNQTVTVSYTEGEVTKTAEYNIIVNAIPTHTVTWSVNGTETQPESYKEGEAITFPQNPDAIDDYVFVGWITTADYPTSYVPELITSATMGDADITYYAVFANVEQGGEDTYEILSSNNFDANANYVIAAKQSANDATMWYFYSYDNKVDENASWGKMTTTPATVAPITFTLSGTADELIAQANTGHYLKGLSTGNFQMSASSQKVALDENGNIKNGNYSLRHNYNNGSGGLRWYNSTTGQSANFYKVIPGTTYSNYTTTVAADTREEAGISYFENEVMVELKDGTYDATYATSNPLTNPNSLTGFVWTSSDESVATVNQSGIVTLKAVGNTTITASFAGNDTYKPGEASFTLQVVDYRQEATVTWKDADGNNITELNVEKGDFIQGITLSCNVEGFTFTEEHLQHLWGTNETHDNYDGLQPAGYIFTPNAVWTAALGITTITATFPGNETHKPASATLTVNVTGGTVTTPYSVAEARAAIDAGTGVSEVYAKGIVCTAPSALNSDGSLTYFISDDGSTESAQLQAYKGKSYNGESFTSADDIQVGDVVTIYGNLTKYGSTYEFAQNNQLYFNQPRLTVADEDKTVTVNAAGQITNNVAQTITINYRNFLETTPSANNVSVLFCDVNGTVAAESYDWIKSIEFNGNGNGNFTMNCLFEANDGEARTGYVKVSVSTDDAIYYSDIITITQAAPVTSHNVTFSVNGTVTAPESYEEGAAITFPEVSDIDGMTFLGWTDNEISGTQASANYVTEATMGNADVTYYAVFALLVPGTSTTYTDELTHDFIGVTGTSYSNWSGKTHKSGAVYAGNSAGGNTAIQLRSNSNSGIVTTQSGGKLKKVTVEWNSNTADDRTLDIYGGIVAYTNASELYISNQQGTKLGSISRNGTTMEPSINGDYEYVGLRSNNGAMYLDKITIEWESGTPDSYIDYCTTIPTEGTLTLNAACHEEKDNVNKIYGTFYTYRNYVMPENLVGSAVSVDSDGKLVVSEVFQGGIIVPAYTALLISTTEEFTGTKDYTITFTNEENTTVIAATNDLRGTLTADEETGGDNYLFYRLTMQHGTKIGFWWGAPEGGKFKPGANKAYLAVQKTDGARSGFAFDDEATGISNVNVNLNDNEDCYDLQGRKVSKPGKGLYIVNGRKVVIK